MQLKALSVCVCVCLQQPVLCFHKRFMPAAAQSGVFFE